MGKTQKAVLERLKGCLVMGRDTCCAGTAEAETEAEKVPSPPGSGKTRTENLKREINPIPHPASAPGLQGVFLGNLQKGHFAILRPLCPPLIASCSTFGGRTHRKESERVQKENSATEPLPPAHALK